MATLLDWDVKLLFDGECPLCMREIALMSRFNGRGRLALEDIAAAGFDPGRYGLTQAEVMGHIHAVLPDGRVVTGMEAFRRSYAALGLSWLLGATAWPGLRQVADLGYAWFARNRLRLTGRDGCAGGACAVPGRPRD